MQGAKPETIFLVFSKEEFEKILVDIFEIREDLVDIFEQNAIQNHPIHIVGNKITGCEMRNTSRRMEHNVEKMVRRI